MSDHDSWIWVREAYHATPAAGSGAAQRVADMVALERVQRAAGATDAERAPGAQTFARSAPWIAGLAAAALLVVVFNRTDRNDPTAAYPVALVIDSGSATHPVPSTDSASPDSGRGSTKPASTIATIHTAGPSRTAVPARPAERAPLAAARTATTSSTRLDTTRSGITQPAVRTAAIDERASEILRAHLDEAAFARLATLVDNAAARELPTAPIVDRAIQGARRRLAHDVIFRSASGVADRLADARNALGRESTPDELTAGAEALFAGVAPSTLTRVRSHRPTGSTVVPLIVLTDLVTNGVSIGDATSAVLSFVDTRNASYVAVSDETMLTIRAEVAADVARGAAPATALSARVRSHSGTAPQGLNRPSSPIPPRPSPSVPTTRPPGSL